MKYLAQSSNFDQSSTPKLNSSTTIDELR